MQEKKRTPQEKSHGVEYKRSLGSCYRLIEGDEEEKHSRPLAGNPLGPADAGA